MIKNVLFALKNQKAYHKKNVLALLYHKIYTFGNNLIRIFVKKNIVHLLLVLFITFSINGFAQIGGDNTYKFLNLPNSARIAALGGNFLAINDNDITLTIANPSLIRKEMNNQLALSIVDYYSDVNYGFAMYSRTFDKIGSFTGSLQYINYGTFTYADATGEQGGDFSAGEYAFQLGWGRCLDSLFSIGANLKTIYSDLEDYNSLGVAVDVSGTYYNPKSMVTMSLIGRNLGRQITVYNSGNPEPLPFELQFGLSKRLKHLPFRYSLLVTHLEKWDLSYTDPTDDNNVDPISGDPKKKGDFEDFGDKLMRHVVVGGEFIPTKNFSIRLGYNYQRRQEMKLESKRSTIGFSWGIGFRVSKFNFSYSRSAYHLAGSPNFITITTNLSDFYRKNN